MAGGAALLVNPTEAAAIAQQMQAVANDAQLRQQLSTAGLQRAAEFSWQQTGKATAALLRTFL